MASRPGRIARQVLCIVVAGTGLAACSVPSPSTTDRPFVFNQDPEVATAGRCRTSPTTAQLVAGDEPRSPCLVLIFDSSMAGTATLDGSTVLSDDLAIRLGERGYRRACEIGAVSDSMKRLWILDEPAGGGDWVMSVWVDGHDDGAGAFVCANYPTRDPGA